MDELLRLQVMKVKRIAVCVERWSRICLGLLVNLVTFDDHDRLPQRIFISNGPPYLLQ